MQQNAYLKELVELCLADRGLPGTVDIRPYHPHTARLETGDRARFLVDYHGKGTVHLLVDEAQISSGTVGARVEVALADLIELARQIEYAV